MWCYLKTRSLEHALGSLGLDEGNAFVHPCYADDPATCRGWARIARRQADGLIPVTRRNTLHRCAWSHSPAPCSRVASRNQPSQCKMYE